MQSTVKCFKTDYIDFAVSQGGNKLRGSLSYRIHCKSCSIAPGQLLSTAFHIRSNPADDFSNQILNHKLQCHYLYLHYSQCNHFCLKIYCSVA